MEVGLVVTHSNLCQRIGRSLAVIFFDLWVGGWASGLYWEELDLATYEDVVLSVSVLDCYGSKFTL